MYNPTLILPIAAIAGLIYHLYHSIQESAARRERLELTVSAARASDLEQWASLDC